MMRIGKAYVPIEYVDLRTKFFVGDQGPEWIAPYRPDDQWNRLLWACIELHHACDDLQKELT